MLPERQMSSVAEARAQARAYPPACMKLLFDHNLSPSWSGRSHASIPIQSVSETFSYTQQMMNRYGTMQPCIALFSSQRMQIFVKEGSHWCTTEDDWDSAWQLPNSQIEALLREHAKEVEAFVRDEEA